MDHLAKVTLFALYWVGMGPKHGPAVLWGGFMSYRYQMRIMITINGFDNALKIFQKKKKKELAQGIEVESSSHFCPMLRLVLVVAEETMGIPSINFLQRVWLSRMQVSFPFLFSPNSNNSWTKSTAEIPEYPQKPGFVPPSPTPPRASFCFVSPSDIHRLGNESAGSGGLVLPGGGKDTDRLVVTGKTVDTGLDKNQAELAILVLAVALKVLAHGNGLLDKV